MIMIPALTSNEDILSELRDSCSSTISANMSKPSSLNVKHKFPNSGRRNSFINDTDQWDFFDNDDDYDEFAADTDDAFMTIHPNKQVGETHTENKKDQKEEEEQQQQDIQDVHIKSRERRKQIIDSALNIVLSEDPKVAKSQVPTNRRNRRRLGDHFMASSSAVSLSTSNHSRRSTSSLSRKSGVLSQDSKLVASQLRAQQKHERSKRPGGARGRRRTANAGLKRSRGSSLQPGGRDNLDSSEHSTATNATIKAHNAYAKTRGNISTASQAPSPQSASRKRLDSLRNNDGPNMTKLVPPLTMEMDSEDKEDVPSSPVGKKPSKTKVSSSMVIQTRFDGKRCTVKRQQYMQQKKDSRDRKLDINASLDKYLNL